MKITIWGTRGSIPTPSTNSFVTTRYGGDTTCIGIQTADHLLILDGGSGLRLLGVQLASLGHPVEATFFFTHVHWDHIQGVPFFIPCYNPDNRFRFYGPHLEKSKDHPGSILEKALHRQQEDLNFPIQLENLPAHMEFSDLQRYDTVELGGKESKLVVHTAPLHHPGGCAGYRVEEHWPDGSIKAFALCSDTEHLDDPNPDIQKLAAGADVMLYDSQYTPDEYNGTNGPGKKGWGHSTWQAGLREASTGQVKKLLLHHHDPLHDDSLVAGIEAEAMAAGKEVGVEVKAAYQGQEILL